MKLIFLDTLPINVNDILIGRNIFPLRAAAEPMRAPENIPPFHIIAMKAAVYADLIKVIPTGIENTLPYFSNESHEKVLRLSDACARWLREEANFLDAGQGTESAYREMLVFLSRFAIHYFLWVIEIARNAIDKHCPTQLVASSLSSRAPKPRVAQGRGISSFYIESCENYLARLIERIAKEKGIEFMSMSFRVQRARNLEQKGPLLSAPHGVFSYLKNGVYPQLLTAGYRLTDFRKSLRLPRSKGPRKLLLYTTAAYQMDRLISDLKPSWPSVDFKLLPGPHLVPSKIVPTEWRALRNLNDKLMRCPPLFSYGGIHFGDLLAQKIRESLIPYLVSYVHWGRFLNRWLDLLKPAAVLSNANRPDDKLLADLCLKKGIPDIVISHGSHVAPKNDFERIEWGEHGRQFLNAGYSHIALQSPPTEGYIDAYRPNAVTLKTGPLIWGRKVKRMTPAIPAKTILHAGTPKMTKSLRFQIYETPDEYIQSLKDLANAVLKICHSSENCHSRESGNPVKLVIKFRPMDEISLETLTTLLPQSPHIVIETKQSFLESLSRADLLVSFSSTTIEEALQNRIPVVLYGGEGRYQHIPAYRVKAGAPLSRQAIYFAPSKQDLEFAIREILPMTSVLSEEEQLFHPYIYRESERESLLKGILQNR